MRWNWQQPDWPFFKYNEATLAADEAQFLQQSGYLQGVYQHIQSTEKTAIQIDLMSDEALKTSEIEGEYLNRNSLRSSIRKLLGFNHPHKSSPKEDGIAQMMVNLQQTYAEPLTHDTLWNWHLMLMNPRFDLNRVGAYRDHEDPMQIVSGHIGHIKVHYEAPASKNVLKEMDQFIAWFNETAPYGKTPLPPLVRASITHLYFVCIHPFEDGNGRIARALVEKSLAQSLHRPSLIALSSAIQKHKKTYYSALETANRSNEITAWCDYFAKTILQAQDMSLKVIQFVIEKTKIYDQVKDALNERQEKVLARLFEAGIDGFEGGLSAEKYIRITKTSRATATRDLQDLVDKGVLKRTGSLKSTRYYLTPPSS